MVHIHALWSPWLFFVFLICKFKKIPVVWSIHGCLTTAALNVSREKKSLALRLYLKWALKHADLIHCTTESEVEDVRRLGLKNECVVLPLGVELKKVDVQKVGQKKCLYLSRIDFKKGIENLIESWQRLHPEGWELLLAGPIEDDYARDLVARKQSKNVQFLGAVYGDEKDKLFASADLFVLPSFSENFGVVVVEALAQGCPVITTKRAPWQELETYHCGRWIDVGVAPLEHALREVLALSDQERMAMGIRGRKLVEEKYLWPAISTKMRLAYEGILK